MFISLKDQNGLYHTFNALDLNSQLDKQGLTLFGIDLKSIAAFRYEYIKRGGVLPITPESIKGIFNGIS